MCLILKRLDEPQGNWRWWGAVSQRQQRISREEVAEVPASGKQEILPGMDAPVLLQCPDMGH